MKKSLLWVVLLGLILVIDSCKKDDDPPPAIVGTWTRNIYEFTQLPNGFTKYWEGYEIDTFGETNYTLLFKQDGTYTRVYTVPSSSGPSLNDTGKWTLDGTTLKLTPDKASDLDINDELLNFPGIQFTVVGDISDIRLTVSQVLTFRLPSDAAIDTSNSTGEDVPDEDIKPVDVTVIYKFDKVK
ncbi:MAG: hypothetical protein WDO15_11030 [Bacteroidota bacterium]